VHQHDRVAQPLQQRAVNLQQQAQQQQAKQQQQQQ
jgi:hypothetical protein